MRRHITYANVAATLALVFAMSGGAMAANHYLISSTKQISPKVMHTLKGTTGPAGIQGPTGREGPTGSAGKEGPTGAPGKTDEPNSTLASGQTETGSWSADDSEDPAYAVISFPHPLSKPAVTHLINPGEPPPAGCSGSPEAPAASPGNLCVFAEFLYHAEYGGSYDPASEAEGHAGPHGAVVFLLKETAGHFDGAGTWAVTG
jgi:hypothetical protein